MPHFYGLPVDLCGKRIAALLAKRAAFFTGKTQQSKDCGALQDGALSGIASKYGAHRGISAVHGTPR